MPTRYPVLVSLRGDEAYWHYLKRLREVITRATGAQLDNNDALAEYALVLLGLQYKVRAPARIYPQAGVPPLQLCVRRHKRELRRMGISPVQETFGAFTFELEYSGTPPYFGRRWAGMINQVTILPLADGKTYRAGGHRVIADTQETVAPTGPLFGDFEDLLVDNHLVRLLGRLKLCGGGADPGGPTLPPFGQMTVAGFSPTGDLIELPY
jgi:hypothetical protein